VNDNIYGAPPESQNFLHNLVAAKQQELDAAKAEIEILKREMKVLWRSFRIICAKGIDEDKYDD